VFVFDPEEKLTEALNNARDLINLAIATRDRDEREHYERMVELYMKVAQELERLQ
jgi:chaperonin cofactor prefoldin